MNLNKKQMVMKNVLLIFTGIVMLSACSESIDKDFTMMPDLKKNIETVGDMHIYFGHQSVGNNILNGLNSLLKENTITGFNIVEWKGQDQLPNSYLLHSKIGKNTDPQSKCDAYLSLFQDSIAKKIDVALLKFCYIDINENTDISALFDYYRNTLDTLKTRHPEKRFIHITVPLIVTPNDITVKLREWIGKPNRNKMANEKRNEFNKHLLEYYKNDPVFDLAAVESTYPDGKRESFKMNGRVNYSLIEQYASDGRHLNELGSKMAAAELVRVLASVNEKNK